MTHDSFDPDRLYRQNLPQPDGRGSAARTPADHIYVVDVLGNLMMRYPRDADPRKILKDIARLLRHSKWSSNE